MSQVKIDRLLTEASRRRAAGDDAGFRANLDKILALDPTHPVARNALGIVALGEQRPADAAEHFRAAAERDPASTPLWINIASATRSLGDDDAEREALERVLKIDQQHLMALLRLAELHERRGEEADALHYWTGFSQLVANIDDAPQTIRAAAQHGREYATEKSRIVGARIDQSLADDLAAATPRDRRRIKAANDALLGCRPIYINRCEGMHYPFLPADEYFDRQHFPWLAELEAATPVIRAELEALLKSDDPGLKPYVQMEAGTPDNRWSPLDGSNDWSSLHLWLEGERIEAACERAPETARIVEALPLARIPRRAPTVFFSLLKAGKRIPPHTGVTNTRSIVHLPLIVPGQCAFRVGGETREWVEGEAFVFDDTIEHEAWNESDRDRAVLILDIWNPHLSEHERTMIAKLFAAADSAGLRRD